MGFDRDLALSIAESICIDDDERSLIPSFLEVCSFLAEFPEELSWRGKNRPSVFDSDGLSTLADRYFESYRRVDIPGEPNTVPDEMVSVIMEHAYDYSFNDCERIKLEHQHSMCSENTVGKLLERYLDLQLRQSHWNWCCGDFVKAIDFLGKNKSGEWIALQIKNRDNSENSSSKAIRDKTNIQKWFRSFSKDTVRGRSSFTNWDRLPPLMQGYGLNEDDFRDFVINYIAENRDY